MSSSSCPDFLPLDEIADLQRDRRSEQCRYLSERSSFFRDLWQNNNAPAALEDLSSLPYCDKEMLRRSQAHTPPRLPCRDRRSG